MNQDFWGLGYSPLPGDYCIDQLNYWGFFLFAGVASGCLRLSENLNLGGPTSYNGYVKSLIIDVEAAGQKMYGWVGYGPYLARSQVCG